MDQEKISFDDMKRSLMNKYQATLIDKLTRQDLDEFQFYIRNQYDPEQGWNREFRMKFEFKLREYFHEEIIQREISSIEAVLKWLKPEDLVRSTS
ncbi:MAG: hypothetical protein ABSG28_00365 [Methanoregula sp.]|jgi:hypothetical protein|uniref:hypothetical protein n=1 Tax=Methanoregula sp. TaxID=2052170 RepID=UPI003C1456A0